MINSPRNACIFSAGSVSKSRSNVKWNRHPVLDGRGVRGGLKWRVTPWADIIFSIRALFSGEFRHAGS